MKTPAEDASNKPVRKRTKTRPAIRRRTLENTYSDPAMRERLKNEIRAAAKGGEPGTWSARKSQLLTLAYQKAGGGYVQRHPNSKQKGSKTEPAQDWQATGGKADPGLTGTTRYLPKKSWNAATPAEAKATGDKKKVTAPAGKRTGPDAVATKRPRKQAG